MGSPWIAAHPPCRTRSRRRTLSSTRCSSPPPSLPSPAILTPDSGTQHRDSIPPFIHHHRKSILTFFVNQDEVFSHPFVSENTTDTRVSQQIGMGSYRWTALSASRDTGNVGPANFSTSTSEFLTPVSPHSLVPAPVSPFQGGPDLYHLHPAGTKALPPSLVPTSIPYLSTLVTEICL